MGALRSEDHILSILDEYFPNQGRGLLQARGDDCAVLAPGPSRAMTSDIFAEDVHFRAAYFRPEHIGHKALAVNLSDLASCGARPEGFVLSLTLTRDQDEGWLRRFARSMADLAERHGCVLAGGDLCRASRLHISVTAWGGLPAALPAGLRRGVARPGDALFVAGPLGLARVGLNVLERDPEAALRCWPEASARHLAPEPLVDQGLALAAFAVSLREQGREGAERIGLMDVSDGLARDLPRLLNTRNSGLGADMLLGGEMLPEEVRSYAARKGEDPAAFAFEGGEDYALLGSCPPALWPDLQRAVPLARRLGEAATGAFRMNGAFLSGTGFDHFA